MRTVGRTVRIRDIPDDVYLRLAQRAAESGKSVPEMLRNEIDKLAERLSSREWLERTERLSAQGPSADIVAALDESRGLWPERPRPHKEPVALEQLNDWPADR